MDITFTDNGYFFLNTSISTAFFNTLAPNSYRTANLQTLNFKYLLNKYTY